MMSISTTSGRWTSIRRRPSRPSPASATTSTPLTVCSSERIPARKSLWSSTSRTRIVDMALTPPDRPVPRGPRSRGRRHGCGCRGPVRIPPPGCPPSSWTRSAIPSRPRLPRRGGLLLGGATSKPTPSSRTTSSRTLSLWRSSIQTCRAAACRTTLVSASCTTRKQAIASSGESGAPDRWPTTCTSQPVRCWWLFGEPAQGRFQAEGVEHGRAQLQRQAAHLLSGLLQERGAFVQPRQGGRPGQAPRGVEVQGDGGQDLPDFVVQFAGQVAALLLLDLHQPAGQGLQPVRVLPQRSSARFRSVTSCHEADSACRRATR